MQKKIFIFLSICFLVFSQKGFSENEKTLQVLSPQHSQTKNPDDEQAFKNKSSQNQKALLTQINKKLHTLSNQLDKVLAQVTNENDKKLLIQLVQNFQNTNGCQETPSTSTTQKNSGKQNNDSSLKKDIIDIFKQLVSPTAIVAYATIICFIITKQILDSGEICKILQELREMLTQIVSLEKWKVATNLASYIWNTMLWICSAGYYSHKLI